MQHPISDIPDNELVRQSLQGDRKSLEKLIGRYNDRIYNISAKMVPDRNDAEDLTQEVLIKVITQLDTFKHDSSFSTWVHRITVNHILNFVKTPAVKARAAFKRFGETLDNAPDQTLPAGDDYGADTALLVEETRQTCMSGMLLCLDKKQRMVFILGELFGLNDKIGGEILQTTPTNFRMLLSRAKKDLYHFMQNKCGLINTRNPCRCAKKTKAFIEAGYVDPVNLRFKGHLLFRTYSAAGEKQKELESIYSNEYRELFLQHTFLPAPDLTRMLNQLLASGRIKDIFNLS